MRPKLTRPIAEIHSPRRVREARPRVLCALRNVRRVPSHAGANPRAAGPPVHFGGVVPDSQHCHHPKGSLAHTPHSSHWGCARGLALGVLCYHCAAAPSALPRGHRVRNASPGQIHTSDMAGNSGCKTLGRIPYISYSSRGCSGLTLYGYARVSVREPEDKNLDLQMELLNQYQGGMCISGRSTTTERTPRHLISPLGPNWVGTDSAV